MPVKYFSQPRDRSLQAFGEWIEGMNYHINPAAGWTVRAKQWITDSQWVDNWKKYWAKVDSVSQARESDDE